MSSDLRQDQAFFELLTGSYQRLLRAPLVGEHVNAAWLYDEAPFVVVAHDTADNPTFVYANKAAQACFGYSWDEFIGLPSRFSAEAPNREERARVLEAVRRDGFVRGYSGVRISKSGKRFRIDGGVVWQLIDADGVNRGQAATFASWTDV